MPRTASMPFGYRLASPSTTIASEGPIASGSMFERAPRCGDAEFSNSPSCDSYGLSGVGANRVAVMAFLLAGGFVTPTSLHVCPLRRGRPKKDAASEVQSRPQVAHDPRLER